SGDAGRRPRRSPRSRHADRGRLAAGRRAPSGSHRSLSRVEIQGDRPVSAPLLRLEDVRASYGDLQALFGVTFEVNAGEIVTLIGANGAGKTTTLRVICGLLASRQGKVYF